MPFAPHIRKGILKALDDYIIPALESRSLIQLLAEPPFELPRIEKSIEREEPVADRDVVPLQVQRRWRDHCLVAMREPTFRFVYTGVSNERIAITAAMAEDMARRGWPVPAGITKLRLPAPGIICFGAYALQNDGSHFAMQGPQVVRALNIKLIGRKVLVALSERAAEYTEASHNLEILDPTLAHIGAIYLDELRQSDNERSAQAQLAVFMFRLRRYLLNEKAVVGNSCWLEHEISPLASPDTVQQKNRELCRDVMDYVQMHLHQPLTLRSIADQFDLSMLHLNRVFRQVQGTTVMRHVTQQRIVTARQVLADTPERVGDVAKLVGFASTASFCTVFRRQTGLSPNEFRQREQNKTK